MSASTTMFDPKLIVRFIVVVVIYVIQYYENDMVMLYRNKFIAHAILKRINLCLG